jgi:hypothetical protein
MLIAQLFFIATVLTIFRCYGAQPFLLQKELSLFSMLQYSVIFHCYSTQSFSIAMVLGHLRCYNTQSFLIIKAREAP